MVWNHVLSYHEQDEVSLEEEERDEDNAYGENVDGEDEEEDDDEEGRDEFEKDGFIVDEEEDEHRADNEEERHRKRKRKKMKSERHYELDAEDYELLQESNIPVLQESKKFKRLKKAQLASYEGSSGFSEDNSGHIVCTDEKLKHTLFGNGEGQTREDIAKEQLDAEEEGADICEDDEMDDFIVDEVDVNENSILMRRKKMNKKKSRHAPGVSSSALQEAHVIFGDADELLRLRKKELLKMGHDEAGEWKLECLFEPVILSLNYLTQKDEGIRKVDIPERMQLSKGRSIHSPTDVMDISEETNWIYDQLRFVSPFNKGEAGLSEDGKKLPINKDDITRFLDLMHVQKLDLPFIAMYRKEDCMTLLKDPDEAEVNVCEKASDKKPGLKRHKKVDSSAKKKIALQSCFAKRFEEESSTVFDETMPNLNKQFFESISKSLKAAVSEREVDDVNLKFNLHFAPSNNGVNEGQYKRPTRRKSDYMNFKQAGLWEAVNKFGYGSEQFGRLISLEKNRMDVLEEPQETPEEMASKYTPDRSKTEQVLNDVRYMAAFEISCEPNVRKYVRSVYMTDAVVSASLTSHGEIGIDHQYQFVGVKWPKDKPLSKIDDAQCFLIQKAEKDKLLEVTISLPQSVIDKLTSHLNEYYLSVGVSKSSQLWNEQRKLILEGAVNNMLLPSMEKEARLMLLGRAKNWLLSEYEQILWNKVSVGPYQRRENGGSSDEDATPKVMACCWGPGKAATTFVMLDSFGEVLDILTAGCLSLQNADDEQTQQRKKNDQQRLLEFMMNHKPHVVILGAVNLSCRRLKKCIYEIIFKMVKDIARDVGQEMDSVNVVFGDESLPHLYEDCKISTDQFPDQPGIVKRTVALGRLLQNPLAMVASLCGPGREILSWKLSSMENFLTDDEIYGMVEQIMVDATNQVGLDLNLAIRHDWLFAPLQFISGLGPRKAASLQRSLVRQQTILTRNELLTKHHLGEKVFTNAVGFLRVRQSRYASNSNTYIDLFANTRIHPESYSLAQDLAKGVYLKDVGKDKADDGDVLEAAIGHVRENPKLLKNVDPCQYANAQQRISKQETLNDIRLELMQGFQDWRRPYVEPNQDEEIYMLSGKAEETLFEAICRVKRQDGLPLRPFGRRRRGRGRRQRGRGRRQRKE